MADRPILFSGPMVRALLDGTKTQTRRLVKPQPSQDWHPEVGLYHPTMIARDGEAFPGPEVFGASDEEEGRVCPYGRPGDTLWVRESGLLQKEGTLFIHDVTPGQFWAKADGGRKGATYNTGEMDRDWWRKVKEWKATPSIHMPRWASRLTLEITEVRVERLGDISNADAEAEGVCSWADSVPAEAYERMAREFGAWPAPSPRQAYGMLWKKINGSYDPSTWVWCVAFKRIGGSGE